MSYSGIYNFELGSERVNTIIESLKTRISEYESKRDTLKQTPKYLRYLATKEHQEIHVIAPIFTTLYTGTELPTQPVPPTDNKPNNPKKHIHNKTPNKGGRNTRKPHKRRRTKRRKSRRVL